MSRELSFIEAVNEALKEEMERDDRVFLLGEDIGVGFDGLGGAFGVTRGLLREFGPERVRDTPISEDGFMGAAVGAAITGMKPIVEIMYADFLNCCMNQLINIAARMRYMSGGQLRVPLVVRTMIGQGRGAGGEHAHVPFSWFINVPGIKVVVPSSPYDAKGLLKTAIRDDSPVIFFEPFLLYGMKEPIPEEEYTIPFGKAEIKREGEDLTIVSISTMASRTMSVAERASEKGISVEVIDPRTLAPLDKATIINSVKKTGRLITVEPGHKIGGVGAEIAAMTIEEAFDYLDAPILRVGAPHIPNPVSPALEKLVIPNEEHIFYAIRDIMGSEV
jgi:pyruvate dehydrogenase E1 component beta subunit